ncbi:MAG TPA: hypothetical protein PLY87_21235 [Planctomycetaceae bacterium]|nr:hypothetical protein [Planctomycetaceae bacterium]HRA87845.1 hypothetical protein [Planctomycetaceae bacterium]
MGNRTQFQNSFDDNDVGNDAESMRAKTDAFEADSDLQAVVDQQIADGEPELTPENALRDWRERNESLQSTHRGIADA